MRLFSASPIASAAAASAIAASAMASVAAAQIVAPAHAARQDPASLARSLDGLTVTPRVLLVSLRPSDEDSELIAWLSRARHVETASLSITRGESSPNLGGIETGAALGVLHVQESLAARRIDGAQQYFTRAFDFGFARDTADVFARGWTRDSVIADVVAVIRAFRPQVLIVSVDDSLAARDPLQAALLDIARRAVDAAAEARRFAGVAYGAPWRVSAVYQRGPGLRIETGRFERALGTTAAVIARDARAQQRSSGLHAIMDRPTVITLRRIASIRADTSAASAPPTSLFDGVDTTFARLAAEATADIAANLRAIASAADSARRWFDPRQPSAVVPWLGRVAQLAATARAGAPWCSHPALDGLAAAQPILRCSPAQLDLDASLDVLRARSAAALLAVAGVTVEATADRELVATGDSAAVEVSVANHGTTPVTVTDVVLWGSPMTSMSAVTVLPDSTKTIRRRVAGIDDAQPWWVGTRSQNRYPASPAAADGLSRGEVLPLRLAVPAVAVPENIRRTSDATVTLNVAGASVTTSLGPIRYPYAGADVGLQWRAIAGVPAVTMEFQHSLEWIRRAEPVTRALRVSVKSHTDRPVSFALRTLAPPTLRVVDLPDSLTLEPGERRELFVQLRGVLRDTDRVAFVLVGRPADAHQYETGYQTIERDYLPPMRLSHTSGSWLQPIDVRVPRALTVLYVASPNDLVTSALTQIGVIAREVTAEQLLAMDLTPIRTIVIGPQALAAQPELIGQAGRLREFVRNGGTLLVMHDNPEVATMRVLPFPIDLSPDRADRVIESVAAVRVLTPPARVLRWPNVITAADWAGWVSGRATSVPPEADPRYTRVLDTHDADQSENANAILLARLGRGTIVYTGLSLDEQIAGGIQGGLRLLVNLLSAGLSAAP
jgi:LmbE family N-acetylglucosaminyl deacetylase